MLLESGQIPPFHGQHVGQGEERRFGGKERGLNGVDLLGNPVGQGQLFALAVVLHQRAQVAMPEGKNENQRHGRIKKGSVWSFHYWRLPFFGFEVAIKGR